MKETTEERLQIALTERDALASLVKGAQDRADESEKVILLLVASGIVNQEKVDKVREFVSSL